MTEFAVDLWLIRADQPPSVQASLRELLDEAESSRAAGTSDPVRRARFIVAHGAARQIAGRYAGVPGGSLAWRRGPHGKPELVGLELSVNLSGCEEYALFAVARGRAVGVDVERLPAEGAALRLARRYYPPTEAAYVAADRPAERFTRLWTRKEAYVKAHGARLADGLSAPMTGTGQFEAAGAIGPCRIEDLAVPGPFRAAVALRGTRPYRTRRYDWPKELTT